MTRLLITGSRAWTDYDTIRRELMARYEPGMVLVSGACAQGADAMCEQVWRDLGGRVERHPANWRKFGRDAGIIRNERMVRRGADECLAFHQDGSAGTWHCAREAGIAGIPVSKYDPSAADYDYRAGLAFRRNDFPKALQIIRRARNLYPHSPEREKWIERETRIKEAAERVALRGTLFENEAAAS
jgi:YspA, cpYpsA-related SLOG family